MFLCARMWLKGARVCEVARMPTLQPQCDAILEEADGCPPNAGWSVFVPVRFMPVQERTPFMSDMRSANHAAVSESVQESGIVQRGGPEESHRRLVLLVINYIAMVRREWPAICLRTPDVTIDAAHNYGLGLIRMLAEYHVVTCRTDVVSVGLAVELEEARCVAVATIRRQAAAAAAAAESVPRTGGRKWRKGWRKPGRPVGAASDRTGGL